MKLTFHFYFPFVAGMSTKCKICPYYKKVHLNYVLYIYYI